MTHREDARMSGLPRRPAFPIILLGSILAASGVFFPPLLARGLGCGRGGFRRHLLVGRPL